MSKHGQPMSQTLAQMQMNELKMNDPKLNKVFDKLKPKATVQLKTSSTIAKGEDFKTYLVVSKNTLRNGVEKITLKNRANPTGVKSFLYRRDGKVTFAIGDMGASIDDIKEKYSIINHEIIEAIDPADVDDDATDADKKAADKNIIMQMRKAMDVKGNMKIEFGDGRKEKVDPKILQLMITAHGKIQKPRDKEKFVAMIGKSKRDMLNIAKKLGTLKAELDKDDVDTVMDVVKGLEKAVKTHQGQVATLKKDIKDENELDEGFSPKEIKMAIGIASDPRYKQGNYSGAVKQIEKIKKGLSTHKQVAAVLKRQNENLDEAKFSDDMINKLKKAYEPMKGKKINPTPLMKIFDKIDSNKDGLEQLYKADIPFVSMMAMSRLMLKHNYKASDINKLGKIRREDFVEEVELQEKYDLYHKSFSDAMQHAYDYAKKKLGITVDPKEIDNKVATGPKKPSEGKTNKYRLKGKGGNLQIQVYNKGGSKPFELNMYKEENEMTKSLKDTVLELWTEASKSEEGFASDAQRKAAFASGYKEKGKKKDKEEGNEFSGNLNKARKDGKKTFKVGDKEYPVKPAKKESVERYLETKQGSLRDAVLQMWGEKHTPGHDEEEKNEKKTLTKEKKDGIKKMTDTGKEVTPVETSVKMPKIKETKNKV